MSFPTAALLHACADAVCCRRSPDPVSVCVGEKNRCPGVAISSQANVRGGEFRLVENERRRVKEGRRSACNKQGQHAVSELQGRACASAQLHGGGATAFSCVWHARMHPGATTCVPSSLAGAGKRHGKWSSCSYKIAPVAATRNPEDRIVRSACKQQPPTIRDEVLGLPERCTWLERTTVTLPARPRASAQPERPTVSSARIGCSRAH